jgi:hypothetical protein
VTAPTLSEGDFQAQWERDRRMTTTDRPTTRVRSYWKHSPDRGLWTSTIDGSPYLGVRVEVDIDTHPLDVIAALDEIRATIIAGACL